MARGQKIKWLIGLGMLLALTGGRCFAGSSVSAVNRYSWGANIGWIDWRADGTHGAAFTSRVVSGYIYSANIGWIFLGDGTPANGAHYSNTAAGDCGVNIDGASNPDYFILSGYAWSANAGWINFNVASPNQPRISKQTGILTGAAWGANIGWLPLNSMPKAQVGTGLSLNCVWDWFGYQ